MNKLTVSTLKKRKRKDFEKIYNTYYKLVFYVSYVIVKDQELAQDIMQDTFVNFMNHIEDYSEEGKVKQYLTTISRNLSYNAIKKKSNTEILNEEIFATKGSVDKSIQEIELKLTLENTLSLEESNIVILKILYDYSFKEIAEELGQSLGTIQAKYYKALEKLKLYFGKER